MLNNQEISTPLLIEDLGYLYPKETSIRKVKYALYKCSCGEYFTASPNHIKSGATKSCGCYHKKRIRDTISTHKMSNHKIYGVWAQMIQRVTNKNHDHFSDYGGRGITVCGRWLNSFENFRDDMLQSYKEGLKLDRIDNNGNYEPSNCRWTTQNVQARNSQKIRSTNTSGYRGITFNKSKNKWETRIGINGKNKYLGAFDYPKEAAIAYDTFVIVYGLEHTKNFP